jgi:3-oxoacyl-[acyl-carrier protein] reductase
VEIAEMFRLDGRTALVTGASQGIGAGVARRLAAAGARVVVAARSLEKLEALAAEIERAGGRAFALQLDLADADAIAERVAAMPQELLPIGILVNNAGITADNLLLRMSLDEWRRVLDVNLTGTFAVTKAVVRGMVRARWGRIITISSVVGLMGNPGQANYAAAKAGLIGFSKSLARELGTRSITVNVVAPGFVQTAMTEVLTPEQKATLEDRIVLGRLGVEDDVASAVHYLASEEASYVTGEVLNVSGGLYL